MVIVMNDEMFRLSLIDMMNSNLLNNFVNDFFKYRLLEKQYVYMQYKIVKNNIVINVYDNSNNNRFKAYIFTNDNIKNKNKDIFFINIDSSYDNYKKNKISNELELLGALLKAKDNDEKRKIIEFTKNTQIKNILLNHFII